MKLQGVGPSLEANPLVGSMRVRVKLAAHSNEIATVNKDDSSFMNARAALSCMRKLKLFSLKIALNGGANELAAPIRKIQT